jgi:hypothetical protein
MKKFLILLMVVLVAVPVGMAQTSGDDKDPSLKPGIRRLHPERERAKAQKKLQEQMSRKAEPKDDPWDTSDEVWGTVDVPRVTVKEGNAVEGRRLQHTTKSPAEQAKLDSLLNADYSITEYGFRRMIWRDLPVTTTIDRLAPSFVVSEAGDYVSKYVSYERTSNEVFFTFAMAEEDSLPEPLRLCVHYCADDPIDFDQLIFSIDGYDYPFYPSETQYGELTDGLYWQWSDDELVAPYKDLVYALAHSHWVAIKLMSKRGIHHVKMLTDGQRADFAATLDLYRLLGGTFRDRR